MPCCTSFLLLPTNPAKERDQRGMKALVEMVPFRTSLRPSYILDPASMMDLDRLDARPSPDETQVEELNQVAAKNQDDLAQSLAGMTALEIAAVCNAKKFLSQRPVQLVIQGIWNGDIIFWDSISMNSVKKARTYNKRVGDPFARLRVPKYQKAFQVMFFIAFLVLYYTVLVQRNPEHVDAAEVLLYFFILAYAYDEFGEILDAGVKFYQTDFWSLWDVAIILISAAFVVTREYERVQIVMKG